MNVDILNEILPVVINLFVVTVFFAYLFIKTPTSYRLKFIGIPLLLVSSFISINTFDDLLGHSVWGPPTTKFSLIGYYSYYSNSDNKIIEAWTYLPDGSTKLYKFPYSEELERKLEGVMKRQKDGKMIIGEFNSSTEKNGDKNEGLKFKILTPSLAIPK